MMTNIMRKIAIGTAVVGGLVLAGYLAVPAMASGMMSGGSGGAMMQNMGSMMSGGNMGAMMKNMGSMMNGGSMGAMMKNMGGMMQNMDQMHDSMTAVHDRVVEAAANVLGLTTDEVTEAMTAGKSFTTLATERAVDADTLNAAIQQAHRAALDQAVSEGKLTQEQADLMVEHMSSVDHMGGGMMSQAASCHGSNKPVQ